MSMMLNVNFINTKYHHMYDSILVQCTTSMFRSVQIKNLLSERMELRLKNMFSGNFCSQNLIMLMFLKNFLFYFNF